MWRVVVKGMLAHKLRLALTGLAIVLGVTFISGTYVLTDTLNNTFNVLFGNVYQHVDFQVRGVAAFQSDQPGGGAVRKPIDASLLPMVRAVPGVAVAEGTVTGYAQYVARDGTAIANGGAPALGVSFDPNQSLSALHVVQGTAPSGADELVMDEGTAQKHGFNVGDRVRVLLAGPPQTFTISGIAQFGTANNLAGATLAAFTLPTAEAILGVPGKLDAIDVRATPGANKAMVMHDIARALPRGVEVVTGQTVIDEASSTITKALSFFSIALLVFAFISLFVGAFTIFNTFTITVGQRTRELALLRIVGASRRQLFYSVLFEAALIGAVASLLGLGLGVLAATGLEALLRGFGIALPTGSLVFATRTIVVSLLVGVGVTVISAIGPARHAVRVAPVAALSGQLEQRDGAIRRRSIRGAIFGVVGVAVLALGLTKPAIELVGLGAVCIFIGAAQLAPAIARPMASVIGRPLARMLGTPGRLGRQNSMRSPRRTAQTSSALMVGLALISAVAVFGASLSTSATASIDQAISANLIVTSSSNGGQQGFSNAVAAAVAAVPGVTTVSTIYDGEFEIRRSVATLVAATTKDLDQTLILRMASGAASSLASGDLLIDTTTATSDHLAVGDVVPVRFAETGPSTMRIGGVYEANALLGSYLSSADYFLQHFSVPLPLAVLAATNGSASTEQQVTAALAGIPGLKVQTRAQFEQSQRAQVNQLLGLIYALLALAVLIALIGIVNTLMLSVFERTRELGLLRAVGMKRRQVRVMIRAESVILAVFGAIVGIVIGTALGVALASSLRQQGITDISIPGQSLVIFLVLSGLLGLVAASWPARRAAKLDVLAAIATE